MTNLQKRIDELEKFNKVLMDTNERIIQLSTLQQEDLMRRLLTADEYNCDLRRRLEVVEGRNKTNHD
jgi:hypothetical protein